MERFINLELEFENSNQITPKKSVEPHQSRAMENLTSSDLFLKIFLFY